MEGAGLVEGNFLCGARFRDKGARLGAADTFTGQRDKSVLSNDRIEEEWIVQLIWKVAVISGPVPRPNSDQDLLSSSGMVKRNKAIAV